MTVEFGAELRGKVLEEYVTVEFCGELCGKVFEEIVTVEFGGVRQSSVWNCAGRFWRNM